jgi:Bacterial archaeo-eukaryotic release factor family 7
MDTLSKCELRSLLNRQKGICVSIFLPTRRAGVDSQQDVLRLRHLIRDAENRLLLENMRSTAVEKLLEPIRSLLDDGDFWLHAGDGLAIFRSSELLHSYRLPYSFIEQVIVSDHFYLKPLLPLLTNNGRFYILAISQNQIRLLEGTRYSIQQVELPEEVPESLAEALKYEEAENEVWLYSSSSGATRGKGGRRPAIFYGQGVGHDDSKDHLLRYFQQINRGLHELLRDEKAPLVLAGVEYLFPVYRQANTYPYLLDQGVAGNPDKLSSEELHKRAWAVIQPYFRKAQEESAAQYRDNVGTERTSDNIREIMPGAYYGRVSSLFVAIDVELWGIFDPTSNTIHVHKEPRFRDDDLLDEAAAQTLLQGGSVYAVEHTKVPGQAVLAAVFRY